MSSRALLILALILTVGLGTHHAAGQDGQYNSIGGDWEDPTDWMFTGSGTNAAPFYPVAGDWIILDANMNLAVNEAFGNALNGSTWTGGSLDTNGQTLTHGAMSTWTFSGGSKAINDVGAVLNLGTFTHATNQRLLINQGATFQNEGTFEFTVNNGQVRSDNGADGLFLNTNGGLLVSSANNAQFNRNAADRMFLQNDPGATIRATGGGSLILNGTLDERGGTVEAEAGSTIRVQGANNRAVAGTLWSTTGTGKIELGGTWGGTGTDLVGTIDGAGSGNVVIGETLLAAGDFNINLSNIAAASGGTLANAVPGTLGWETSNIETNGNTITLNTPVSFTGGSKAINDPGTVLNPTGQTFTHATNQRLLINQGATFQNEGTFEFTINGGQVRSDNGADGLFLNTNGGLLVSSANNAQFNRNAADRMFLQNDPGATIRATGGGSLILNGTLDERGGTVEAEAGSTIRVQGANNRAVAGTLWSTTGTGKIELGGTWGGTGTDLVGTIDGAGSGNVVIGETLLAAGDFNINLSNIAAASGGTLANAVPGTLGWETSNIETNGNTITLNTPVSFTGGSKAINDPGTVLNPTGQTFTHATNQRLLINQGATFQNEGTFEFTINGGQVRSDNGADGLFLNTNGGLLVSSANNAQFNRNAADRMFLQNDPGATIRATGGGSLILNGTLDERGGTVEAEAGSTIRVQGANNRAVAGTLWSTTGTGKIELGGTWGGTGTDLVGTIDGAGSGNVVIGETLLAAGDFNINLSNIAAASGGTLANAVPGTLGWETSNIETNGNTITLNTPVSFTGGSKAINDPGTVLNPTGQTFTHATNQRLLINQGATFQNEGTFEFTVNNGQVRSDNGANGTFLNAPGAILSATDSGTVTFNTNSANRLTLDNQGILQVVAENSNARINIQGGGNVINVPQFDGIDTLTGGTWRVSAAPGLTGELDLNPAPDGSITTLSNGAEVELAGTGTVNFPQLNLMTLDDGTFRVSDGYVHSGDVATTANGGTFGGAGGTIDGDLTGSLTFDVGSEFTGDLTSTLFVDGDVFADDFDFNLGIEDILDPGVDSDLLDVTGVLDLSSVTDALLNVEDLTGGSPDLTTTEFMLLFAQADNILGFNAGNFTIGVDGVFEGTLSVVEDDNGLFLVHTLAAVVPEPQTIAVWGLLGLAFAGIAVLRRRRK